MATSRLPLLGWVLCCFLYSFTSHSCWAAASRRNFLYPQSREPSTIASKQYRTAYHFQPPKNWINDPNGPMYYNGIYHLFYQYNPHAAVWGNISWGHSISRDLINWIPLDLAINPTEPFDIKGCWTGSATILPGNKPVILYTGDDAENRQVQNVVVPKDLSDPFLREWTKPGYNPIMAPVNGINSSQFRDPTTGWLGMDGHWRVALGAEIGQMGMALLYRSKDFAHWERAGRPLHSSNVSGMWECPDFYPVPLNGREGLDTSVNSGGVKHVLKMSVGKLGTDHYKLGTYLEEKDSFVPDNTSDNYWMWLRYDYGKFYASKTFFDAEKRRRILWGWSNEMDSEADDIAKGWAGIQTIPRTVWLDSNGKQLLQWPIEELESLRTNEVHFHGIELKAGGLFEIKGIKASQADVEVEFELPSLERAEPFNPTSLSDPQKLCQQEDASVKGGIGPFGLLVLASHDLEEYTAVFFRVYKAPNRYMTLMCSDQCRSSMRREVNKTSYGSFIDMDIKQGGSISLRTVIDHSVVESFGDGGKTCITARVYPAVLWTKKPYLYAFNNGSEIVNISKLQAWDMARARVNIKGDERNV